MLISEGDSIYEIGTCLHFLIALPLSTLSIDTKDTVLLTQPAISNACIAFVYANDLWVAASDGTDVRRLTSDEGVESTPAFSPDGKIIAYTRNTEAALKQVFVYSLEQDRSYPVTDGLSDASDPVFDESGKYLYFFASTDAGPVKNWFAMSNLDMVMTSSIYLAVLQKEVPSPLAPESDEEKGVSKEEPEKEEVKKPESKTKEAKEGKPFTIDFEGLESRIISLPTPAAPHINLQAGSEGQIYYQELPHKSMIFFWYGRRNQAP